MEAWEHGSVFTFISVPSTTCRESDPIKQRITPFYFVLLQYHKINKNYNRFHVPIKPKLILLAIL